MPVDRSQRPAPGRVSHDARRRDLARPIAAALALPPSHVTLIEQSHERCAALGVSRIERPDFTPLGRSDLQVARDRNLRLHSHAAPVMEMLYEQIVNTQSMVVLCDATGIVIHSIGDDDFLARASQVALAPGANWSESAKGTNAVGTALVAEAPTLVHADEHYLHANHFLTCSAAPIVDPRGNILGVLDVSGDHRSYHQHTMALVKMSARMIENHWLSDDYRNAMRLHFHARVGHIGTLMEGILAVRPDGRIVGANRSALEQLGLSGVALRMHSLASLFGTSVGALVDRFRSPLATPLEVQTEHGRSFHLHARFDWPVWSTVAEAAAATVRPSSAEATPMVEIIAPLASRSVPPRQDPVGLAHLQTGDAQVDALVGKLRRVLDRSIPILIVGETGTGKDLLAHAIHADSARAHHPFVAVNCAAMPESLIEFELFGDAAGAIDGARGQGALGKILQARGGTLFLDEVGELPLPQQARLLRMLQECQVTPPASSQALAGDVAIICATQRKLRDRIDAQAFREDLYHRLNGLAVRLPPLRERSDLAALARRILDGEAGDRVLRLSAEVQQLFERHPWPGNVRELVNVLRSAAALAGTKPVITVDHLPDDFVEEARRSLRVSASTADVGPSGASPGAAAVPGSLEDLELDAIRRAVEASGGNISAAARRLGVSRNTIYRRVGRRPPAG